MNRNSARRVTRARLATAISRTLETLERRVLFTGEPHVIGGEFLFETKPHRLQVQFDQNVSASLSKTDFYVSQYGSDATRIPTTQFALDAYDVATNKATLRYIGYDGIFDDGHYRLNIYRDDVLNTAGQPLASSWSFDFDFKLGDANRDLVSNDYDQWVVISTLQSHPEGLSNATLSQGDVNYDGVVDNDDFAFLEDNDGLYGGLPELERAGTTLSVFRNSDGSRTLEWKNDCAFALGYRIQYSFNGKSFGTLVSQTSATSFTDVSFNSYASVLYRIRPLFSPSLEASHAAAYTDARSETTGNALASPTSLTTSNIGANRATVGWQAVSGASVYEVSLSRAGKPFVTVATTASTSLTLDELNALQNYTLRVRAISTAGISRSTSTSFVTLAGPPSLIRSETDVDTSQLPLRFKLTFDQPVFEAAPGRLAALNASLARVAANQTLPITSIAIDLIDSAIVWVSATAPAGTTPVGSWLEGFYELIVYSGVLKNAAGQYPGQTTSQPDGDQVQAHGVYVEGDLTGDGAIDDSDLAIISANYNLEGGGYAKGDVNRDGFTNFDDLNLISQRFNTQLTPLPATPGALAANIPTGANADTRHTISLQWTLPAGADPAGFDIFRSTDGNNFTKIASTSGSSRAYLDQNLWEGRRYYYRVRSFVIGEAHSQIYSYSTPRAAATTVLAMPTDVHVRTITPGQVWIEWNDVAANESEYIVERTTTPVDDTTWQPVMSGHFAAGSTWAEDSTVSVDTRYFYRVRAVNGQTESAAAITFFNSALPSADAVSAVTVSASKTVVSWDFDTATEDKIDQFVLQTSIDGTNFSFVAQLPKTTRSYIDLTPVVAGKIYQIVATKLVDQFQDISSASRFACPNPIRLLGVNLDGAATIAEGTAYSLGLSVVNAGVLLQPDEWLVDWGDNSDPDNDDVVGQIVSGDLRAIAHNYGDDGSYSINVTASFATLGALPTATLSVSATNVVPTLHVEGSDTLDAGDDYTLSLSASDPGSDQISSWHIAWGDGTTNDYSAGTTDATHAFPTTIDSATIAVTATDEDGTYDAAPITVTLQPQTPSPISFAATSSTAANVTWTRRSTRATGYVVEACTDPTFINGVLRVTVDANDEQASLGNLQPAIAYYVRVGVKHYSTTHFDDQVIIASTPATLASAPTDLEFGPITNSSIGLRWTPIGSSNSVIIERSRDGGSTWSAIATVAADTESYSDSDLEEGHPYRYRQRTTNGLGTSSPGGAIATTALSAEPEDLTAEAIDSSHVHLAWLDTSDSEDTFVIQMRRFADDEPFSTVAHAVANSTSFDVGDLSANTAYTFRVAAIKSDRESSWTTQQVLTPASGIVPDAVILDPVNKSALPASVQLSWSSVANTGQYRVERSEDDVTWTQLTTVSASVQTATDSAIAADHTYRYRIIAIGALGGEADASNVVTATTTLNAPSALSATRRTGGLTLYWSDNSPNEQWFTIWKFDSASATTGEIVASVPAHDGMGVTSCEIDLDSSASVWLSVDANTTDATSASTSRLSFIPFASATTSAPTANTAAWSTVKTRRAILEKFNELYNTINYEPYVGIMKGAAATGETKRGNDWDQALLLQDQIAQILVAAKRPQAQVQTKLSYDVIEADWSDIQKWFGVGDKESAASIVSFLEIGAISENGHWRRRVRGAAPEEYGPDWKAGTKTQLWHATLEVSGGIGKLFPGSMRLDPSWKFYELRNDSALFTRNSSTAPVPVIGRVAGTQFDDKAFLGQSTPSLQSPLEWYEQKVLAQMYSTAAGGLNLRGSASLADATYAGPILPRNFMTEAIRTGGYNNIATTGQGGDYAVKTSAGNGQVNDAANFQLDGSGAAVNMYHRLIVRVTKSNSVFLTVDQRVADHSTGAALIHWKPDLDDSGKLFPAFDFGNDNAQTSTDSLSRGTSVSVAVKTIPAGSLKDADPHDPVGFASTTITAGQPLGLMLQAQQYTAASVAVFDRRLADTSAAVLDNGSITEDDNDLINAYQEQLLASLAARYANEATIQSRGFMDLDNLIHTPRTVGWGFVTGANLGTSPSSSVEKKTHLQSPLFLNGNTAAVGFDLKGVNGEYCGRFQDVASATDNYKKAIRGANVALSHLESSVIEEVLGVDAFSTTKGMQLATHAGAAVYEITNQAQFNTWKNAINAQENDLQGNEPAILSYMINAISASVTASNIRILAPSRLARIQDENGHPRSAYAVWFQEPQELTSNHPAAAAYIYDGNIQRGGQATASHPSFNTAILQPAANHSDAFHGDPVQQSTGALYQDEQILSLPTAGLPLGFSIHYDTRFKLDDNAKVAGFNTNNYDVGLGVGWSHNFSDHLKANGNTVTWIDSQGQSFDFKAVNGSFQNPAGKFGLFSRLSNKGYRYTDVDQSKYTFDPDLRLQQIQDSIGDSISLRYWAPSSATNNQKNLILSATYAMPDKNRQRTISFGLKGGHYGSIADDTGRTWTVNTQKIDNLTTLASIISNNGKGADTLGTHYDTRYTYLTGARACMLRQIRRQLGSSVVATQQYDYYANGRLLSTTNASGATEYFSYDTYVSGELFPAASRQLATTRTRYTDFNGNQTTTVFDTRGNVSATINDDRSRVSQAWYSYGSTGSGSALEGRSLLKATTDENGLSTLYSYVDASDSKSETATTTTASSRGLPRVIVSNSTADPGSNVTAAPAGLVTKIEYDTTFWKPTMTNVGGDRITIIDYNGIGQVRWSRQQYKTAGLDGVLHSVSEQIDYTYDTTEISHNNFINLPYVAKMTRPKNSSVVTYQYTYVDADKSLMTEMKAGVAGIVTTVVDQHGNLVRNKKGSDSFFYTYDALNRLRKTSADFDGDGVAENAEILSTVNYDAYVPDTAAFNDNRQSIYLSQTTSSPGVGDAGSEGESTPSRFVVLDAQDQPIFTRRDGIENAVVSNRYDGQGNLLQTDAANARSQVTDQLYDNRGRVRAVFASDGGLTWNSYDGAGRILQTNTAMSSRADQTPVVATTTTSYYGASTNVGRSGRPWKVVGPDGMPVTFDYNVFGEVVTQSVYRSSGNGLTTSPHLFKTTTSVYDGLGRPTETRDSHDGVASTRYDANGNVIETARVDVSSVSNFMTANLKGAPSRSTQTLYDTADRPFATRDAAGNVSLTEYDAAGHVSATYDPRAVNTAAFVTAQPASTAINLLKKSGDTPLKTYQTRYEYDAAGRMLKTYLPDTDADTTNDRSESTAYYPDGRVRSMTDRAGHLSHFRYHVYGAGESTLSGASNATDLTTVTDGVGRITKTETDALGQTLATRDINGGVSVAEYDSMGRVLKQTSPASSSSTANQAVVMRYAYDLAGHPLSVYDDTSDPLSPRALTLNEYDAAGRLIKTRTGERYNAHTDVFRGPTRAMQTFYDDGEIVKQIDPRNIATEYVRAYSANASRTLTTKVNNVALSRETYDSLGDLTESRTYAATTDSPNKGGRVTTYRRDALGRATRVRTPSATNNGQASATEVTETAYDAAGNVVAQFDADAIAWIDAVPSAAISRTADAVANHFHTTTTIYDAENRPTAVTQADPGALTAPRTGSANDAATTMTAYTIGGDHLFYTVTTGPNGQKTTLVTDAAGRSVKEATLIRDLGEADELAYRTWTYDTSGGNNYVEAVDRNNRRIRYELEDLGRTTRELWFNASGVNENPTAQITSAYDHLGNLLSAKSTDPSKSGSAGNDFEYKYDVFGEATTYDEGAQTNLPGPLDVTRNAVYHSFNHDAVGNLIYDSTRVNYSPMITSIDLGESATRSGNNVLTYGYDQFNSPRWMIQSAGTLFTKTVENVLNNLGESSTQYRELRDREGLPDGRLAIGPAPIVGEKTQKQSLSFVRDKAGRTTAIHPIDYGNLEQYEYDRNGRIVNWHYATGEGVTDNEIAHDDGGAIDSRSLTYDATGQLTKSTALSSYKGLNLGNALQRNYDYTYDKSGNRTDGGFTNIDLDNRRREDAVYRYTYDNEGNLTKRFDKTSNELDTFTYDHRNRMTSALVNGTLSQFAYDAADRRVAKKVTGANELVLSNTQYSYSGDNPVLVFDATHLDSGGRPVAIERHLFDADGGIDATDDLVTGKVVWYQKDHLGSVKRTVVDDAFQQQFDYDPFGNAVADVSNRAVTLVANPLDLAFDAFNKIGATLGSGKAQGSGGLAWVKDPAATGVIQWTISKEGRARPAAGASAPGTVADGRALYAFGKSDGAIQATLVDAGDPAAGRNVGGNPSGYGVGLVARGGAVTLWIEPTSSTPTNARAFRIVALNGTSYSAVALNFDAGKTSALTAGDKVRLSVAGGHVEVWVNDVRAAQGTLPTTAASSTAKTWGMTFHTGASSGPLAGGLHVDGFDNLSMFAKAAAPRFGFTGAEFDVETGLYYMGARYYNPVTGSFTSQDPNPPSWQDMSNLYRYAWNDPIDMSDPTGMGAFKKAASWGGGVGKSIGSAINATASRFNGGGVSQTLSGVYQGASIYNASADAGRTWSTLDPQQQQIYGNDSDIYQAHKVGGVLAGFGYGNEAGELVNEAWYNSEAGIEQQIANAATQKAFKVKSYGRLLDAAYSFAEGTISSPLLNPASLLVPSSMKGNRDQIPGSDYNANTGNWRQDVGIEGIAPIYGSGKQAAYDFGWAWQDVKNSHYGSALLQAGTGLANVTQAGVDAVSGFSLLKSGWKALAKNGCFLAGTDVLDADGDHEVIEDIHVGQRVATDGGVTNGGNHADDTNATEVNRKTWRKVTIHAVNRWSDGTKDEWNVETLRPLSSFAQDGIAIGGSIDLESVLDFKEMGVPDGLVGTIESIEACPTIERGSGRVVTTTVNHLNDDVYRLTLRNRRGRTDTLGVTGSHRFFDEVDGWQQTEQLTVGDRLRTTTGDVEVLGVERVNGAKRVYNMTVESDHVYYVGGLDTLTHNNCALRRELGLKVGDPGQAAHVVPVSSWRNAFRPQAVKQSIKSARDVLRRNLIDLDSWHNGFIAQRGHLGSHTNDFLRNLGQTLTRAEAVGGREAILDALNSLKTRLHDGEFLR